MAPDEKTNLNGVSCASFGYLPDNVSLRTLERSYETIIAPRLSARSAELTYVHFLDPGANPPSSMDMPFCRAIVSVKKPPTYTAWNLVRGLMGRWPLPVLNYRSQEMVAALKNLREKEKFDIVHFDSMHMASYETLFVNSGNPRVLSIYDWHNIESESMRRYSLEVKSAAKRFYANSTVPRLQKLEKSSVAECVRSYRLQQTRGNGTEVACACCQNRDGPEWCGHGVFCPACW